jgi:hypothetical protein
MLKLLTESRVAEAIFEGTSPEVSEPPRMDFPGIWMNLSDEGIAEALRLKRLRTLLDGVQGSRAAGSQVQPRTANCGPRTDIPVTRLRRCSLAPGAVLLFDLKTTAAHGEIVELALAAVHVAMTLPAWPRRPAEVRQRIARILPGLLTTVSQALDELGLRQLAAVRPLFIEAMTRARGREQALRNAHASMARQLVQAELFDRRAVRVAAAHRRSAAGLLEEEEEDQRMGFNSAPNALKSSADLRAVLVVSRR